MDFSKTIFWFFLLLSLPLLFIGNRIFSRYQNYKKLFILALSIALLGVASAVTLEIFLIVTLSAYVMCKVALRLKSNARKALLFFLIPILLLPLLYYKYAYFLGKTLLMQNWDSLRGIIIPIGISFYTFQIIGFCIDTLLRNYPMPKFIDYMNFCAFFPQIVAGPIERRDDLLPQISRMTLPFDAESLNVGIRYIILGLFFKIVMADNLAIPFLAPYSGDNAWMVWTFNLLFTFRIYFDFAGYGLTAYGVARCLGITLRMNFLAPYTAANITDFWRRWHTSLTLWFRDYIYFPLGGSRTKRWALNILIVFSVSGLWHGAGWNFVLWGLFSGIAMVVHRIFRNKGYHMWSFLGWIITFGMMVFIWMFFYITDIGLLKHSLSVVTDISNYGGGAYLKELESMAGNAAICVVFITFSFLIVGVEYISGRKHKNPYELFLTVPACAIMLFLLLTIPASGDSQFIYFSF